MPDSPFDRNLVAGRDETCGRGSLYVLHDLRRESVSRGGGFVNSSRRQDGFAQVWCQSLTMLLIVQAYPRLARSVLASVASLEFRSPHRIASPRGRSRMSVVRPIWLNLAIFAAICLQGDAVFAQIFNGLQKPVGTSHSSQGPHYFTILGHIAKPNCYELPTSSPSLVSFVEFAGNLTRTAAGPIRIVRDGRSVQSTFYSNKSTLRLIPGDIVVVDGKFNQGQVILRGNESPTDDPKADVTLAITGLRDYPVVMTIAAERATIRWVTRHLGLDPDVANYVKAITQRQSEPVFPDKRLASGTVLIFNPAYVDGSRLPDDLPVPVNTGRPSTPNPTHIQSPPATLAQPPLTGLPSNQYGAATGRARVPTIENALPSSSRSETFDLSPDEQTFVKRLLTDPSSVLLDEPTPELAGRAVVPKELAPRNVQSIASDSALAPLSRQPRSRMTGFSPEAPRPYASEPAAPEPLQPFGTSRNLLDDSTQQRESTAESSSSASLDDPGSSGNSSLAVQAAPLAATVVVDNSDPTSTEQSRETAPPTPSGSSAADLSQESPVGPVQPVRITADVKDAGSPDRSRLLPPPPSHLNWPVISILTVGFLGAVAACFLIYSIAHENPAPRVAQIDTSGRYWLDRLIENDIPIEEEAVNYPHRTQLFGKPAPIQRVDAAHRSVPRPHFSTPGGKSGVLKETPAMPDAPSPEISDSGQKRIVRIHKGGLARQQAAAVPAPHSVGTKPQRTQPEPGIFDFAATVVFGDTGQSSNAASAVEEPAPKTPAKPTRQFRLDAGHKATEATEATEAIAHAEAVRPAPTRKTVSVQPSRVVVQGANLLDRILSSVDHEQNAARSKAISRPHDDRQSDERGNS